jgi:monovalent cation:H+ antiporter-2, CPA2 family
MHHDFLSDLLVVFALGGLVVYALRAIKLPPIVGLLLAGAAMGPSGLSLVGDQGRVETLAEIGVVLLLFTIGIEFSMAQLLKMWRILLGGGLGQMVLTIGVVTLLGSFYVEEWRQAVFLGFLASLSSTAIVLRLLGERAQLGSPIGRIALGILLLQDLCIVPLMLLTPFLAGHGTGASALFVTLGKAAVVVVGVVIGARWIVPPILLRVVRTRSRELFLTLILVLCLGTAWLTALAGLSLALGAFLAGLSISESEYSHQALAEAIPFRDAFGSLFFISIGMLLDVGFVAQHLGLVLLVVVVIVVLKTVGATLPALLLGYPLHTSLAAGLSLAQVGEFSFVLSRVGRERELIDGDGYQLFLSASVITMLITPALLYLGQRVSSNMRGRSGMSSDPGESAEELSQHVIVAGYGVNGQNLTRALSATRVPYAILEMNPETVRAARGRGEPIHYGDCTRAPVLEGLGIARAKMYVVAISDAASTRQSVSLARSLNPNVYILVRTRFVAEMAELRKLGADEVIPEEFETSIEIFARVLHRFDVPRNVVLDLMSNIRTGMYEMLRTPNGGSHSTSTGADRMAGLDVERLLVKDDAPVVGRSLSEIQLRNVTGASVLAVQRGEHLITNPPADFRLKSQDVLVLLGAEDQIGRALELVDPNAPLS